MFFPIIKFNEKENKGLVNQKTSDSMLGLDIFDEIDVIAKKKLEKENRVRENESSKLNEILKDSIIKDHVKGNDFCLIDGMEEINQEDGIDALQNLSQYVDGIEGKSKKEETVEIKQEEIKKPSLKDKIKKGLKEVENKINKKLSVNSLEDKKVSKKEKGIQYFNSIKVVIRESVQNKMEEYFNLEKLGIKIPDNVIETLKRKDVVTGIVGGMLLVFIYFVNYLPYKEYTSQKVQLEKLSVKHRSLKDKVNKLKVFLREKQNKSKEDEQRFNELKMRFFNTQFKDTLAVTEYIHEVINRHGVIVNDIGKTEKVVENMETAATVKNGKVEPQPNVKMSIVEVRIPYKISATYQQLESYILELETGKAFLEVKNNPVQMDLQSDGKIKVTMNIAAYLDDITNPDQNVEMVKNDLSLEKNIFNKVGQDGTNNLIESVNIYNNGKSVSALLKMKSGKKYILKSEEEFTEGENRYKIVISEKVIRLINLTTKETTEIMR